jgi:hypothetical protein
MRQPPSPLLLSARKRRPRRTPPRGAQPRDLAAAPPAELSPAESNTSTSDTGRCALVQPFPDQGTHGRGRRNSEDDDTPFE